MELLLAIAALSCLHQHRRTPARHRMRGNKKLRREKNGCVIHLLVCFTLFSFFLFSTLLCSLVIPSLLPHTHIHTTLHLLSLPYFTTINTKSHLNHNSHTSPFSFQPHRLKLRRHLLLPPALPPSRPHHPHHPVLLLRKHNPILPPTPFFKPRTVFIPI